MKALHYPQKPSDLDMEKGTAIVRRMLVRRKCGGWYFGEPKTSRSRRTVPLPATLVKMLTGHRRKRIAARLKMGAAYQNNELVWLPLSYCGYWWSRGGSNP